MRRIAVLLLLAAAAALLPASKADAYKLFKHRWYSKTLTYYDATGGRYKERSARRRRCSTAAARGSRCGRRRDAARGRVGSALICAAGGWVGALHGPPGIVRNARILVSPDLGEGWPTPAAARMATISVLAHEMTHVLGLDHEDRRCAT